MTSLPAAGNRLRYSRKQCLGFGIVIAIIALLGGAYWWYLQRNLISTDDAYVRADIVTVSPHIAGYVSHLLIDDNQTVKQGQIVLTIESQSYLARLNQAQAALRGAEAALLIKTVNTQAIALRLKQQASVIAAANAQRMSADANYARRNEDALRYQKLYSEQASSSQLWEQAHAALLQAKAAVAKAAAEVQSQNDELAVLRESQRANDAMLAQLNAALAEKQALLKLAQEDLGYTVIRSPIDGVVAQRTVRAAQYVEPGLPLFAVVPSRDKYVIANFKETQVGTMLAGQRVDIKADTYPDAVFHGHVQSISPGSGAEFALLPPDNATGNFTKIVQRIPVKITLDKETNAASTPLRAGMSVVVTVDTGSPSGQGNGNASSNATNHS